jgi:hypothetical protein
MWRKRGAVKMIFDIRQTYSGLSAEYEMVSSVQKLGQGTLQNNFIYGGTFHFSFLGKNLSLRYEPLEQAKSWLKKREEKTDVPYSILLDGEVCGIIGIKVSKGGIFSKFDYFAMNYLGKQYSMYEIGLGKEGIKYPVFCGERQVALLEKDTVVYDNLDIYHAFAVDEVAGEIGTIFALYLDARSYANRGKIVKASVEHVYYRTINKKLLATYHPEFKDSIRE